MDHGDPVAAGTYVFGYGDASPAGIGARCGGAGSGSHRQVLIVALFHQQTGTGGCGFFLSEVIGTSFCCRIRYLYNARL
jgi:hypothetical protein